WAYTVLWRKDGEPLWKNPRLLADPDSDPGHGIGDARRFAVETARLLGCDPDHAIAGYEDAFYYAWREGTLPDNVDPYAADLDDPLERRYLAALLDRGMGVPTGYSLPLE